MKSDGLTSNPIVREVVVHFNALRQRGKTVCLISNMPCLAHEIRLSQSISHCPPTSYPGFFRALSTWKSDGARSGL